MDIVRIILTALFSILLLFVFTKLTGYRQVSQLSMFDYINGISIGSIAAELAVADKASEFWRWTVALCVYGTATLVLSLVTERSLRLRRWITGCPILLMEHGKLYDKNFDTAHLDFNEFLTQLRGCGYFDLSQLDTVLFEPNGTLSVLPKSAFRCSQPNDWQLSPTQECLPISIILDGELLHQNLRHAGFDELWLHDQLNAQHFTLSQVFYAFCSADGQLVCFGRNGATKKDILE